MTRNNQQKKAVEMIQYMCLMQKVMGNERVRVKVMRKTCKEEGVGMDFCEASMSFFFFFFLSSAQKQYYLSFGYLGK
jgi:hypothetical protein